MLENILGVKACSINTDYWHSLNLRSLGFLRLNGSEQGFSSECYGMWVERGKGKSIVSLVYIHYLSTKELLMLNFIIPSHLSYMVYRKQLWHFSLSLLDGSSLAGVGTGIDGI